MEVLVSNMINLYFHLLHHEGVMKKLLSSSHFSLHFPLLVAHVPLFIHLEFLSCLLLFDSLDKRCTRLRGEFGPVFLTFYQHVKSILRVVGDFRY